MASILEQSGYDPDRKLKVVGTSPVRHDGVDKVTGRAKFGADLILPGMLVGKILRSPHPHAIVKSIDTSKAEALPGVKAVVTRDDFPEHPQGTPMGDLSRNFMAREKVFYEGHAVAAVAATSEAIARKALKLIAVEYEVLPHVIDPVEAMQPGAPILHDYLRTKGIAGAQDKPHQCGGAPGIRPRRRRGRIPPGRRRSSSASSGPGRSTRATSSRRAASPVPARTARSRCGAARKDTSSCATQIAGVLKIDAAKIRVTAVRARRRLRRQDHVLCRVGRRRAVAQGAAGR